MIERQEHSDGFDLIINRESRGARALRPVRAGYDKREGIWVNHADRMSLDDVQELREALQTIDVVLSIQEPGRG